MGMLLTASEQLKSDTIDFSVLSLPELWYNFTVIADRWAPVVIVGSFLIGFIIYELFRKTRDIQQWAVKTLMIKLPGFVFVLVYVYSGLYKLLNLM